ncbi:hypothetical protein JHK85_010955 [Glycine max]|nr:hypothetical protein JHK85_010955 [Glycine max]
MEDWKLAIEKYKRIPHNDILKIHQESFDALGEEEKTVSLDIGCCFKGSMPEAAEAIRRLKQVVQKEVTPDDQPTAHSSHLSNGSKSKDAIQGSSVNSLVSSGEIQNHEVS